MPDYSAIIAAIAEISDAHKECVESLRKELHAGLRASAVQIEAEMEVVNQRIKELSDHVATQNSNVFHLKEESEKRKQAVEDFRILENKHKKRDAFIKKHWFWLGLGFIFFVAIVVITVEIVGAKVIIENAIKKAF